jgi:transposase-like protein
VRWYLCYKLSYRDLVEMMAGRGLAVAHTTILRWVQRFVPAFGKRCPAPLSITRDGYAASHRAFREMPDENAIWKDTKPRSSKYLNNMIEQDHRSVKSRIVPMLGFKVFKRAAVTIAGIELLHRIRKGQFDLDQFGVQGQAAPAIWTAVQSA